MKRCDSNTEDVFLTDRRYSRGGGFESLPSSPFRRGSVAWKHWDFGCPRLWFKSKPLHHLIDNKYLYYNRYIYY